MAVKTIPELPEKTTALVDADLLVVDDGTHSYKIPWRFFKTLLPSVTDMKVDPEKGTLTLITADGANPSITMVDPTKQPTLTFDSTPTANSDNPVTSNGIYVALDDKANKSDLNDYVRSQGYQTTIQTIWAAIGSTYDENTQYSPGDYVLYSNVLNKCTTATKGVWTAANWAAVSITSELKSIAANVSANATAIKAESEVARAAENAIAKALGEEVDRAEKAEKALSDKDAAQDRTISQNARAITSEVQRAEQAEKTIKDAFDALGLSVDSEGYIVQDIDE